MGAQQGWTIIFLSIIDFRYIGYFEHNFLLIDIDRPGVSTIGQLSVSGENEIQIIGFIEKFR